MQTIALAVPGRKHTCKILVGSGLLARASVLVGAADYSKVFVITDHNLEKLWLPKLQVSFGEALSYISLPPGEQAKRIEGVQRIWTAMRRADLDRSSLVIILGGGVIGDLGSFAASTYMRGVGFVQIPTTLLAQIDSSLGGKTGFDFGSLKNLIGTFAQPEAVLIDTDLLQSLPPRELIAGFAEMLKHGLIADADYFDTLAQKPPKDFTAAQLPGLIATSIRIKAGIVGRDETESGERKLLNFGHTAGHAVEALSWDTHHPLLHGEAVAIGMVIEADLSRQSGLTGDAFARIKQVIEATGLPTTSPVLPVDRVLEKMHSDKKNVRGVIKFTLLESIGKAVYNQTVDESDVSVAITRNMESRRGR